MDLKENVEAQEEKFETDDDGGGMFA